MKYMSINAGVNNYNAVTLHDGVSLTSLELSYMTKLYKALKLINNWVVSSSSCDALQIWASYVNGLRNGDTKLL